MFEMAFTFYVNYPLVPLPNNLPSQESALSNSSVIKRLNTVTLVTRNKSVSDRTYVPYSLVLHTHTHM